MSNRLPSLEDYEIAIDTAQLIKAKELIGGYPEKHGDNLVMYVGGFCVVFPYKVEDKKYAVRCWFVNVTNAMKRTRLIAEELQRLSLPYFVGFDYIEEALATNDGVQPIILMDWVDAHTLKEYISANIGDSEKLRQLAENFKRMAADLHENNIAHGDLQHGNIMVSDKGEIVLVDYDSMYVPALEGFEDEIKGLEGYQHPSRWNNNRISPKADYFSELVIYTSLLALAKMPQLWTDLNMENTETMLFSADDIKSGGSTPIFRVLETDTELKTLSLAIKEALRHDSIDELLPLEVAVVSQEERIASQNRKKWADNGYVITPQDYNLGTGEIKNKWADNGFSLQVKGHTEEVESIKKKW